ncbi:MAG: winged helix-turn-helix transcriptional regulator [Akkermansiaceae bacterium]|nr:winged helix-turn-helix transcriptional regulator [Akkermansiaceae bacterium]
MKAVPATSDTPKCLNTSKVSRLKKELAENTFIDMAVIYKALSHPCRLQVMHLLSLEPCCVCDLSHVMGIPIPTASQYLRILRKAGLVEFKKDGKFIIYSLTLTARNLRDLGDANCDKII